jgi:hypothetical protein
MKPMSVVVRELLDRLESEGIGGVYAWFAGRPHVIIYRRFDGYVALLWREGVVVEIRLDENFNVKTASVKYYEG